MLVTCPVSTLNSVSMGMFRTKSMLLSWGDSMLSCSRLVRDMRGLKSVSRSQFSRVRPNRFGKSVRAEMSSSPE